MCELTDRSVIWNLQFGVLLRMSRWPPPISLDVCSGCSGCTKSDCPSTYLANKVFCLRFSTELDSAQVAICPRGRVEGLGPSAWESSHVGKLGSSMLFWNMNQTFTTQMFFTESSGEINTGEVTEPAWAVTTRHNNNSNYQPRITTDTLNVTTKLQEWVTTYKQKNLVPTPTCTPGEGLLDETPVQFPTTSNSSLDVIPVFFLSSSNPGLRRAFVNISACWSLRSVKLKFHSVFPYVVLDEVTSSFNMFCLFVSKNRLSKCHGKFLK